MKISILAVLFTMMLAPVFSETMYGSASSDFSVKATVDSFVGKAVSEPFEISEGSERINIVFEIAKMETGKKKRDKEMLHMFHADEYPALSGSADAKAVRELAPSGEAVELPIEFVMHGVTNEVMGSVSGISNSGAEISFDVDFPLSLKTFGLKAPSVMLMIRVKDTVMVSTHVTLSSVAPEVAVGE